MELKLSCHGLDRFDASCHYQESGYALRLFVHVPVVSDRGEEFNSATYIIRTSLSEDVETSIVQDVAVN